MTVLMTTEVCEASGATFRQMDYWARTGLLVPVREANGSGTRRLYSVDQVERAAALAVVSELTQGGNARPRPPLLDLVSKTDPPWQLRHGRVVITVELEDPA